MTCIICKKKCDPWLLLKNDKLYTDVVGNIGETIQTCSYLCTKQCNTHIEKNYSHLVLNKEDFDYLRPVQNKVKVKFEILTYEEIMILTDFQKEEYYKQEESCLDFDHEKLDLYKELEIEDMKTLRIEDEGFSSSEDILDDY